ncbi:MAG: PKD domain-containing protein, partial [Chloroflexota bacterium]
VWVMATSQSDERIRNADEASVTFTGYEGVEIAWLPAGQTVTDTLSASFMLVITNTGNMPTTYAFDLEMPGLSGQLLFDELPIPARSTAVMPLTVYAGGPGVYEIDGTAVSDQGTTASDTATLTIFLSNQPPLVNAGPDQVVVVNSLVQFNGSASDPDDDPLTFSWDFGDGNGATGTLTPTHIYQETGLYTVILIVSDTDGHVVSDTLQVLVVTEAIFAVDAGPDVAGDEGSPLAFNGVITDTGGGSPYLIEWNFGDGNTAEGSLSANHAYADNGTYTVTLTVTNSENQVVSDTLLVTVHNVAPTVTAAADQSLGLNETFSGVLAAFSDPGWLDTHTAVIDWGDGTVSVGVVDQAAQTVTGSHTYTTMGVYTVTITVMDNDGGEGSDSLFITTTSRFIYLPLIVNN